MQPKISIRQFLRSDLARVLEIDQVSFGDDAWDEKLFLAFYRKCPDLFLVAMVRRHIAGYIITCAGRRDAELASIAVDPSNQRSGVGETMLNYTLAELRARSVKTWWLMVETDNKPGLRFYEKFGFQRNKIVKRYYGAGRHAWRMRFTAIAAK